MLIASLAFVLLASAIAAPDRNPDLDPLDFTYHSHERMTEYLTAVSKRYPNLATLYDIGKSVEGQILWVIELSAAPPDALLIPNVKLVANIHGNEAVGRELLLHLVQELTTQVGKDDYITWLLNNSRIHLLPSLNPDGFKASTEGNCQGLGRPNSRGKDLNRNFPDFFEPNNVPRQPETVAIQEWLRSRHFLLSGGLHGGAVVASYPYDNLNRSIWEAAIRILNETNNNMTIKEIWKIFRGHLQKESLTPDDDVFKHLASVYARSHSTMERGRTCIEDSTSNQVEFTGGIVNGAKWYALKGGMQDYNYFAGGCLEVTLEVSCCKYPKRDLLERYWHENKKALLQYLGQAQRGVRGIVRAADTGLPVEGAQLKIAYRDVYFNTTKRGEFWRILLPGDYLLQITKDGYETETVRFTVPMTQSEDINPSPVDLQINIRPPRPSTVDPMLLMSAVFSSTADVITTEIPATLTTGENLTVSIDAQPINDQKTPNKSAFSSAKSFGASQLILAYGIIFLLL